jgi:hypothetical protein
MSTSGYFSFTLLKQSSAKAMTPVFAQHPQIADPFFICKNKSNDPSINDGYPSQPPILFVDGGRGLSPEIAIDLFHNVLDKRSQGIELISFGPSNDGR